MISSLISWIRKKPLVAYFLRKVNNNYWEVVGKVKINTLGPVIHWKGRDYVLKLDSSTVVEYQNHKAIFYSVDNSLPLSLGDSGPSLDPDLLNKIVNTHLWARLLSIGRLEVSLILVALVGFLGFMIGLFVSDYMSQPEYINTTTTTTVTVTRVITSVPGQ